MKFAYVDTSYLLTIFFEEDRHAAFRKNLTNFDSIYSSSLLEAEARATFVREGISFHDAQAMLTSVNWVIPDRPLSAELSRVLQHGYLRGADLWHLACALFFSPDTNEISFLSADEDQKKRADQLGFKD